MINNVSSALNAYQQALSRINASSENTSIEQSQPVQDNSFGSLVKSAAQDAVNINKQAEATSISAIAGKASIQDVVLAVSNAEVALETVVAVRDSAIKAYNTIIQMPI